MGRFIVMAFGQWESIEGSFDTKDEAVALIESFIPGDIRHPSLNRFLREGDVWKRQWARDGGWVDDSDSYWIEERATPTAEEGEGE